MKTSICYLISCLLFYSCQKSEENVLHESLSEIHLTFDGYDQNTHKSFIDIEIENLLAPIEEQVKISEKGHVDYVFSIKEKKEVNFNYDGRHFSLVVDPSEILKLTLDFNYLMEQKSPKIDFISGSNKETNGLILKHQKYVDGLVEQSTGSAEMGIDHYKKERLTEMTTQLAQFQQFVDEQNIIDAVFIDRTQALIKYRAGIDLCRYPFLGRRSVELNTDSDYLNFMDEIDIDGSDLMTYTSYVNYLESIASLYNIMVNIGNTYKTEKGLVNEVWPSSYFLKIKVLKTLPKGPARELMMAHIFKNEQRLSKHIGHEIPTEYLDTLKHYTNRNLLSQINFKTVIDTTSISDLIKNYDLTLDEKTELLKIYEDSKDKLVFHDFWASWCGPCMSELPNYNQLIEETKEDVVFVMFGVLMDQKEWEKTRKDLKLEGQHYLLSKNQLAFYEKYFGVKGYPHHQIVNPKGQIVIEYLPKVEPKNYEFLTDTFDKHKI